MVFRFIQRLEGKNRPEVDLNNQTFSLILFENKQVMAKTSFTAHNLQFLLHLSKSFGKLVEIPAYTKEEVFKENPDQNPVFNFNTMKVSTRGFHFNGDEDNER